MKYLIALLLCFTLAAQQTVNNFTVKTNLTVLGSANLTNVTVNDYVLETLNQRLTAWVSGQNYQPLVISYNSSGVATNSTVLWPDGSGGVFTATSINDSFLSVDAFTITHVSSGKTITQPTVSRNSNGSITNKPALTVL